MRCIVASLTFIAAAAFGQAPPPLEASLNEAIVEVPSDYGLKLKTTIFKPPGEGPFPLVLMNHGKAFGNPQFQGRARFENLAAELVHMGYAVGDDVVWAR
jgi:poly(3-hydroxybutyrate) depolymerase